MVTKTEVETVWRVPDDLWSFIPVLFGPDKSPGTPGRPATPARVIFEAVVYVLRTGCQWQALPRQHFAPPSTVHGRYRQWVKEGLFEQAWRMLLEYTDATLGIGWKWQAMDGAITKAPLGGEDTGPSPVDRAKSGAKRSILTDERCRAALDCGDRGEHP